MAWLGGARRRRPRDALLRRSCGVIAIAPPAIIDYLKYSVPISISFLFVFVVSVDFTLEPADNERLANLCGQFDEHLRQVEGRLGVEVSNRGNRFRVIGDRASARVAGRVIKDLYTEPAQTRLTPARVHLALQQAGADRANVRLVAAEAEPIGIAARRGPMRGRTLNDAFIILVEAQNTTVEQMKMFLTRIGFGSKAVITGDVTQVDLPRGRLSGLRHVTEVLKDVDGISFTFFKATDVVRHPLVQSIVTAYEAFERDTPPDGPAS